MRIDKKTREIYQENKTVSVVFSGKGNFLCDSCSWGFLLIVLFQEGFKRIGSFLRSTFIV